ncbi:MAG TPA: DEAD/DEAH box helicase family protein [Candidatus Nitrosocosmicus sp.]
MAVQDYKNLNLSESTGIAIRGFPLGKDHTDYILFIDRIAVGVIEAKPEGSTLSGVVEQSQIYLTNMLNLLKDIKVKPIYAYETTGIETLFRDLRNPDTRPRRVFSFHRPETLKEWMNIDNEENIRTLRSRLKKMEIEHHLIKEELRDCQVEAIRNLEHYFSNNRQRSLIQMATGSGKTFTAVSFVYRLIKFSKAKRILFLVDRKTLGTQALKEFQQYLTPDDGSKFTELYNVQHLTSNLIEPVNKVVITTIQRLYSMLSGEEEFNDESEEVSLFDKSSASLRITEKSKQVSYNPKIPIETFDFIIIDECHRSIYNLWRQALEYFDAFIIGLTVTPSKQTIGFFNNNPIIY